MSGDSPRYAVRTTTVDGKVSLREIMMNGYKVGDITKKELVNLVLQGILSLCQEDGNASYLKQLGEDHDRAG